MRTSLTISGVGHAAILLWSVIAISAKPYHAPSIEGMPVDVISAADFSKMVKGTKNAPKLAEPKQLVEKVGEEKPSEDPLAKIANRQIAAATDTPPIPEKKPPTPHPVKKPPEPKVDPIADAIKKDQVKKPEPKREAKAPIPPRRPPPPPQHEEPQFDPKRVEALLNKREPQRLAATGSVLESAVSLGEAGGAAQLSQSEIDALRARLAQLWSPPAGAKDPRELIVRIRFQLKPDGTLDGFPTLLAHGTSSLSVAASESALRAVLRGQPYTMLKSEHYEQWKDIEITFDPRDMIPG